MTEKDLNQLFYLNKETSRLQKELKELKYFDGYSSTVITDMPKAKNRKDSLADYVVRVTELEELININLRRIQLERSKLERYIGCIADSEIRLIFRLRHINGMTWEDIGFEVNMDRRTVSRKHYAYLKSCPQCP